MGKTCSTPCLLASGTPGRWPNWRAGGYLPRFPNGGWPWMAVQPHQSFLRQQILAHLDVLDESIEHIEQDQGPTMHPWESLACFPLPAPEQKYVRRNLPVKTTVPLPACGKCRLRCLQDAVPSSYASGRRVDRSFSRHVPSTSEQPFSWIARSCAAGCSGQWMAVFPGIGETGSLNRFSSVEYRGKVSNP